MAVGGNKKDNRKEPKKTSRKNNRERSKQFFDSGNFMWGGKKKVQFKRGQAKDKNNEDRFDVERGGEEKTGKKKSYKCSGSRSYLVTSKKK